MDLERITHPLRLAKGSHQPGSGKGCAMNVISYINGDTVITDRPACSDGFLGSAVMALNDQLADMHTGYLSAEDSIRVLDIAWKTVGTAGLLTGADHLELTDRFNDQWRNLTGNWNCHKEGIIRLYDEMITTGRAMAGLDNPQAIDPVAVDSAMARIGA